MKRIVLADDSATARLFTRRCLEIVGCREAEFVEAADGAKALEALRAQPADLVVTDLTMPTMDGRELLKRIKASPRLTDVPVLVVTSAGNPGLEEELLGLGALAVLNKPINPPFLAVALERLLPPREGF